MSYNIEVRIAHLDEAEQIAEMINGYASNGLMLNREIENIIEHIRNFVVAILDGKICGCCSMSFFTNELAEIRSVAVKKSAQNMGLGKLLIEEAEKIFKEENVKRSFVLTRNEGFFKKLGYKKVDKNKFPQKIWRDCSTCPKIIDCDEIAMEKMIS